MSHQRLGNEDQFKGTGKASGEDIGVRATMEARMMKPFAAALSIAALITSQPAQARTVGMVCTGAPLQSDGSIPANAARGSISVTAELDTSLHTYTVRQATGTQMFPIGKPIAFNGKNKGDPAAVTVWKSTDSRRHFLAIQLLQEAGNILFAGYVVSPQCQSGSGSNCNRQTLGTVEYYQAKCSIRRN